MSDVRKRTWRASKGAATSDWTLPAIKPAVKVVWKEGGGYVRFVWYEDGIWRLDRLWRYVVYRMAPMLPRSV